MVRLCSELGVCSPDARSSLDWTSTYHPLGRSTEWNVLMNRGVVEGGGCCDVEFSLS